MGESEELLVQFDMTLRTEGAAFDDGEGGFFELARILRGVADQVAKGKTYGLVKDINGNTLGSFTWVPKEDK